MKRRERDTKAGKARIGHAARKRSWVHRLPALSLTAAALLLCMNSAYATEASALSGGLSTVFDDTRDAYSLPSPAMPEMRNSEFTTGRTMFRQSCVIAPARSSAKGLGPLYNRVSCIACHARNGRGQAPEDEHGAMRAMLLRLSIPGANAHGGPKPHPAYGDQLNEFGVPGVPGEGVGYLVYEEHTETLADGMRVALRKPAVRFKELAYGPLGDDIMVSPRIGPAVYGLGLLEAIADDTLLALQDQPKPAGIRGRVNLVWDAVGQREAIGRFGAKANVATLEEQVTNAFVGDLGITTPLSPEENCSAAQAACRQAPSGRASEAEATELSRADFAATVFYHRMLAVPARRDVNDAQVLRGEKLFRQAHCASCHIPELRTRKDAILPWLSDQAIQPYTDLLLHDMGEALADGRPDFRAAGREWRTPPLWGVGLAKTANPDAGFLHDGRARTLLEAVMWHGGEAEPAREAVREMTAEDREALLRFLESL